MRLEVKSAEDVRNVERLAIIKMANWPCVKAMNRTYSSIRPHEQFFDFAEKLNLDQFTQWILSDQIHLKCIKSCFAKCYLG